MTVDFSSSGEIFVFRVAVAVGHAGDVVRDRAVVLRPRTVVLGDLPVYVLQRHFAQESRADLLPQSQENVVRQQAWVIAIGVVDRRDDPSRMAVVSRDGEGMDDVTVDEVLQLAVEAFPSLREADEVSWKAVPAAVELIGSSDSLRFEPRFDAGPRAFDEIARQLAAYPRAGGRFVLPIPTPRVVEGQS